MESNMDIDPDLYNAEGFCKGIDFLSTFNEAGAPTTHSPNIGSSELSNFFNAADASEVTRARLPQRSMQGHDETFRDNHPSNEVNSIDLGVNQTFLYDDSCDEADPKDLEFNEFSNDFQLDEAYLNNTQSIENDPDDYQVNGVGLHIRHSVDANANTEEIDTLNDQLPNVKRRKIKGTESSYMPLAYEHAPSTTFAARAYLVSVSTDRSPRFSASTTRSSFVSTSTNRSSVASVTSLPADQPGEEDAYKWKCLMCHMGEGDSRKAYVRKDGNTPSEQAPVWTPEPISNANPVRAPKPKDSWKSQNLLEKHIRQKHLGMFQRINSSEYFCIFCPCGNVTNRPCEGRLPKKDALLNHVSTAHHEIPEHRIQYQHSCAPLDSSSYHVLRSSWTG